MNEIKHFVCTHTFTSDKSRKSFLTPPENRIPHIERLNEKDWAKTLLEHNTAKDNTPEHSFWHYKRIN